MQAVRGILSDIDGVLHVSMQPLPGAVETLAWLEREGYSICLITNTTTQSRRSLCKRLQDIGLPVRLEQMVTAPVATAGYIRQYLPGKACWLLSKGDTAEDFEEIELVDALKGAHADVVIIGGAEELLTYEAMNTAFRLVSDGAALLAMHTNLYWRTANGLQLDSGAYIRALEIATGKEALVMGKPEKALFEQALRVIDLAADEAIMLGDDIENDVAGGQRAGLRSLLVCTGKHKADSPLLEKIHPDGILPSIADLSNWLHAHKQR